MPQFALLLTTIIWAATFPATKLALAEVPTVAFLLLRFIMSAIAIGMVVVALRQRLRCDGKTLRMAAIASVFLFLGYITQTVGLRYTTASNSAFITALYVVFVPLFLGRFTVQLSFALMFAVGGLMLLLRPTTTVNLGDVYTLACAVAFAFHIISLEWFARKSEYQSLAIWQVILVCIALLGPAVHEGYHPDAIRFTPTLIGALLVTGVLATGFAFYIQVWAQRHVPAQRVALIFALEPALSAWMSWLVLGERLDASGWLGSILILAGVLTGTTASRRPLHDPLQP
jgi:drug/metabolite transporter (DMT)-like permease